MEYTGKSLSEASKGVIEKLEDLGGNGGVIALDGEGNIEYVNSILLACIAQV